MTLFLVLLLTLISACIVNSARFFFTPSVNRGILFLSLFLVIAVPPFYMEIPAVVTGVFLLFLSGGMTYYYSLPGGFVSVTFSILTFHFLYSDWTTTFSICMALLIVPALHFFFHKLKVAQAHKEKWITHLMKQSKQLHIYREISTMMQQTFRLDKLLQTILTAVTAGHGLGFNRAIIFLINDQSHILHGKMAVGPRTAEEGFHIWEDLVSKKYELSDLIEIKNQGRHGDNELNSVVQSLSISIENEEAILQAFHKQKPLLLQTLGAKDNFSILMGELFQMDEFALVPLIHKGKEIGILVIDNIVNKKKIHVEELESVVPFANQAAIAIEQAKLYEQTEELAKRDGLTGLYNQRSLQHKLDQLFSQLKWQEKHFSILMLDIDFFKHFNDRNGHLLGNELLIQLSHILQAAVRQGDAIFRFGGEEFSILLPDTSLVSATDIGEKIRQEIETASFPEGEHQPFGKVTLSLGVASTEQIPTLSKEALIQAADEALYQAKSAGKNRVRTYEGCFR